MGVDLVTKISTVPDWVILEKIYQEVLTIKLSTVTFQERAVYVFFKENM